MVAALAGCSARAQIILEPRVTGTVGYYYFYRNWGTWGGFSHGPVYSSQTFTGSGPAVGLYGTRTTGQNHAGWWRRVYMSYMHGIIEIDLDRTAGGGVFPPPSMTLYNWSAFLTGLTLTSGPPEGVSMQVTLNDLKDSDEDGLLDAGEYWSTFGALSTLFDTMPEIGKQFSVDVTNALRRDLFGEGAGDITTGFILTHGNDEHRVGFQPDNPRIQVFMGAIPTPTITPTPTVTPMPTCTPTVTPRPDPGVDLFLNSSRFTGGDPFRLRAFCTGAPGIDDADLYVLLDVYGHFWFWPGWTKAISLKRIPLAPDRVTPVFILDFIWPDGDHGAADGLLFHGAMTRPGTYDFIGNVVSVSFGFGPGINSSVPQAD